MNNPFKKGDTVYHPTLGQCCVARVQDDEVFVTVFQGDEFQEIPELLSFDPWAEPNHIRPECPIKVGWWLIHLKEDEDKLPLVRYVSGKDVYSTETQEWEKGAVNQYVFVRYLGEDWKEEQS